MPRQNPVCPAQMQLRSGLSMTPELRPALFALLLAVAGGLLPAASRAAEPQVIPLIAIDSYAPTALWTLVFIEYFIPEVDRRLAETGHYKIRWNKAFGGTIAKTRGVLDALQYDLADIGIVTTPYHPDKVPFYNLPYVTPLVTTDIGLVARAPCRSWWSVTRNWRRCGRTIGRYT